MCVQQAVALLHTGTKLEDVFPQEGWRGLVARELRRLGGLLKHHFEVVKRTGNSATLSELDAALREIRHAIEALSERR